MNNISLYIIHLIIHVQHIISLVDTHTSSDIELDNMSLRINARKSNIIIDTIHSLLWRCLNGLPALKHNVLKNSSVEGHFYDIWNILMIHLYSILFIKTDRYVGIYCKIN